jgi:3-hydroxybutyryl-CoA dehydrogenase
VSEVKRIAVIGAGTMGSGIAHVAAVAGYQTILTDANADAVDNGLARIAGNLEGGVKRGKITREDADSAIGRITAADSVSLAVAEADFVIEAVLEDLLLKQDLFSEIDQSAPPHAVLASNTSSLSISQIAAAVDDSSRVAGMHFFNPVHIMKLVEIVGHQSVSEETIKTVSEVALAMGKQPITVTDSPGFASSRLGVVLGLEAMRMVEQGVASAGDIDKAMELGYGHPMGPLRVTDLVGLDVRLAIAKHLHTELNDDQYSAPQILLDKVAAGELGKKTGKGFYEWETTKTS